MPSKAELVLTAIDGAFTLLGILLGAVAATATAVLIFYRQKQFELVQKRYLEESVDVLITNAELTLNRFVHNWSKCLDILKAFRDTSQLSLDELDTKLEPLRVDRFALTAVYRLSSVIGDDQVLWTAYQRVVAFGETAQKTMVVDVLGGLREYLSANWDDPSVNPYAAVSKAEVVESLSGVLYDLKAKSDPYYWFISEMQKLVRLFEQQRFSFKALGKLKENSVVLDVVSSLKARFPLPEPNPEPESHDASSAASSA